MKAASSATQTKMNCCLVKALMMECGPFSDGFHAWDSSATLDRADTTLFHTMRTNLVSVPPTEPYGLPCEDFGGD